MKKYKRIIFWFRQDLRIFDNKGFFNAVKDSYEVLPLFIFDENILNTFLPKDKRIGFLLKALDDLEKTLKNAGGYLHLKHGNPEEIFFKLIKKYGFEAIYTNKSYGPYGQKRDFIISNLCKENGIEFKSFEDYLLVEPERLKPYKVFTPYFNAWQKIPKDTDFLEIQRINCPKIYIKPKIQSIKKLDYLPNDVWETDFGKQRLQKFDFGNYDQNKDFLDIDGTSRLSPYIRFGLLSIRQVYQKALNSSGGDAFISELAWRDFWQQIAHHFPETYYIEFQTKRRNLNRENNVEHFNAWKEGKTGYPLIDAIMMQLKAENRISGRARMIVGSFLTKDLLVDRRWGEKYFRQILLDHDTNTNLGNWQRIASVGADPKPLRIFNPILQGQRFDRDCRYVKKWLPDLVDMPNKFLLNPFLQDFRYIKPIVNHSEMVKKVKAIYYGE